MEFLEQKESRQFEKGGAGAYDTLRCDVVIPPRNHKTTSTQTPVIWGEDFHLNRLRKSYTELIGPDSSDKEWNGAVEKALQQSHTTLHRLLSFAESDAMSMHFESDTDPKERKMIQLIRVTILWSPIQLLDETASRIIVRGHACSSNKLIIPNEPPVPIWASVAAKIADDPGDPDNHIVSIDKSLPTRHSNPQSKIASWCRLRRQMETVSYKAPGIEEVLMVRKVKDKSGLGRLEILEGLSSNFFVIYKNGNVRTATDGCLHGYVRHLVLGSLDQCGLQFDPKPIYLDESHQWDEAFITSSSRLIYPISKIFIQVDPLLSSDGSTLRELWIDEAHTSTAISEEPKHQSKWRLLLNAILKAKGFDIVEEK
eukprot:scaffold2783_cov129-Cylindrotheca_fusiformis.AAC.12